MNNRTPLLIALAALLASLGLVLIFWPSAETEAPAPQPSAKSSATSTTSPSAVHDHPGRTTDQLHAQRAVVLEFATALAAPEASTNPDAWLARLKPLVSPDLLEGYRYTDPRLLPHQAPLEVGAVDELLDEFLIEYPEGVRIQVTLTPKPDGWVVDQVDGDG